MTLNEKKCVPCKAGAIPVHGNDLQIYLSQVPEWECIDEIRLRQSFTCEDFASAMRFVNAVAQIAEEEGHHPDITIHYNTVTFELWTHAIGGLSENDFILAAKIDNVQQQA